MRPENIDGLIVTDMVGPVRWGIAGTGTISQQMTKDFRLVGGRQVVAVASRNQSSADAFGDEFDIPHRFDDYARMLESVDAVYIGTPHVTHFDLAHQALERGRSVLCEKPIGLNGVEVRLLAKTARQNGVFLMEAMWMKFNPLHQRLLEMVEDGVIGEVRSVRSSFGLPFSQDGSSRWKPGVSTLLDQGIYPVTLSWMFLGKPQGITAAGVVGDDAVDLRENFTFCYPEGRFAQGAASMTEYLELTASIAGTRGWITLDPGFWYTRPQPFTMPHQRWKGRRHDHSGTRRARVGSHAAGSDGGDPTRGTGTSPAHTGDDGQHLRKSRRNPSTNFH